MKEINLDGRPYYKMMGWTALANKTITDLTIGSQAYRLFCLLAMHTFGAGHCTVRIKVLAREIGLSERRVGTHLNELEKARLIIRQRHGLNRSNTYYLQDKPVTKSWVERYVRDGSEENVLSRSDENFRSRINKNSGNNKFLGGDDLENDKIRAFKKRRTEKLIKDGILTGKEEMTKKMGV
jgi:DNA-binding transcriptional ArsR family regulator